MRSKIKWTEEQESILRENHNTLTLVQIHEKFFDKNLISYKSLAKKTLKMGLIRDKTLKGLPSKNTYNYKYWSIPNLINSYFAGYIAADGCILKNKNNNFNFQLKLAIKDEQVIDNLIKEIDFKGKKIRYTNPSELVRIALYCFNENAKYLEQYFNIIPNKTKRLRPTNLINKYLIESYIIGLIDGDGSIEIGYGRNNKPYPRISYTSSSLDIVIWLKDYLDKLFQTTRPTYSKIRKNGNCYQFYICGFRAGQLIDYFCQFPVPKLARKWRQTKILEFIENSKNDEPKAFKILNLEDMKLSIQRDYPQ